MQRNHQSALPCVEGGKAGVAWVEGGKAGVAWAEGGKAGIACVEGGKAGVAWAPLLSVSQIPKSRTLPQSRAELQEHLDSAEVGTQVQDSPGLRSLV